MGHYTKRLTKVVVALNKASKAHAGQAKTLKAILKDQYSIFHHHSAEAEPLNKSPSCSSVVGATGVMEGV